MKTRLTLPARVCIFLLFVLGTGCHDPPVPSNPVEFAGLTDPPLHMVRASLDATNYAPPGWPLAIGDRVTLDEWSQLRKRFHVNEWGMGVVWVVDESGIALPFSAAVSDGMIIDGREGLFLDYIGHRPNWRSLEKLGMPPMPDNPAEYYGIVKWPIKQ